MANIEVILNPGDTLVVKYSTNDRTNVITGKFEPSWLDYIDEQIKKAGKVPLHEDKTDYSQTDFHQPV